MVFGVVAGAIGGILSLGVVLLSPGEVVRAVDMTRIAAELAFLLAIGGAIWWGALIRTRRRWQALEQAMRAAAADQAYVLPIDGTDRVARVARALDGFIQARASAQLALGASERRLRDIAEAASEWIWETDSQDRFTFFSDPPSKVTDIDCRRLLGRQRREVAESDPDEAEDWRRYQDDVAARRPFRDFRYRMRGRRGDLHYLRVSGKPAFEVDGRFIGYRGVAMEVTSEVEAEQRASEARHLMMDVLREAAEAADQANHSKTRFLAAASHDLRQPLQALGLFVATLAQRPLPDDIRAIVGKIEGSLEALEHLLDTLLDISRLDAGVVEAHCVGFSVQELFKRLALEYVPLAESAGLSMRFVATTAAARSDPALLERILRNLLSNAVRYTDTGGIVVGVRRRGDALRIEVWDTGRGIPLAEQREIFREFHQLGGTPRERRQGLGLGLAIVDRLAALLGHRIELLSMPDRGSVFSVVVPANGRAPLRKAEVEPEVQDPLNGRFVVVVDDDSIVRDGLRAILEIWGCRVAMAEGQDDAIEAVLAAEAIPDAIIADYRLRADVTGAQVVRALRALLGEDVPALLITGDTSPERLRQAAGHGLSLLHKPVRPDRLRAALQQLLEDRRVSVG
jgi:PAS domain S-box-containing protein